MSWGLVFDAVLWRPARFNAGPNFFRCSRRWYSVEIADVDRLSGWSVFAKRCDVMSVAGNLQKFGQRGLELIRPIEKNRSCCCRRRPLAVTKMDAFTNATSGISSERVTSGYAKKLFYSMDGRLGAPAELRLN